MTSTTNERYSTFSPEFEAFLKSQATSEGNALASLPLPEVRKAVEGVETAVWTQASDNITWDDCTISGSDGSSIPLRVYQLKASKGSPKRVALMIHGGGWSLGGVYSDSWAIRALITHLDMVVVTVGYRLAPEDPFPKPFNDCLDTLRWILNGPEKLPSSGEKIVMAGFSAGGNLAAAITQWACTNGLADRIAAQVLISPATCHYKQLVNASKGGTVELGSIVNASSPFLSGEMMKSYWDNYDPDGGEDVRVSPLLAEDFSKLPPTYVQVSGADPLRDEGIAYAAQVQAAGIKVGLEIYPGMPHAYQSDIVAMPGRERTMVDMVRWLGGTLGHKVSL